MKKFFLLNLMAGAILFMISSCDLIDEIKLDPDKTVAKEGNYWTVSSPGYSNVTASVTENNKGIAILSFNFEGQDYSFATKVSETKIQDFVYSNGDEAKPFTLVDFDAKVGDMWEYKVGTHTITREVISKSTDDDYLVLALGLMIKVIEVEETIPEGVTIMGYPAEAKSITWTFNHKFGWIGSAVTKRDNSVVYVGLFDTNCGIDE